jgi:hypothetical protein
MGVEERERKILRKEACSSNATSVTSRIRSIPCTRFLIPYKIVLISSYNIDYRIELEGRNIIHYTL